MQPSAVNEAGQAGQHASLFDHKPNQEWARRVARSEWRGLPPSFALEDLEQEALIAMWKQCERYNPSRAIPFQAFAYMAVRGTVLMACRRRHYKEATHEELKARHYPVDEHPDPEQALIEREPERPEEQIRNQRRPYRKKEVVGLLAGLPAADAFLVKRAFIDGVPVETLAKLWGIPAYRMQRRLNNAVRLLRKAS
jgi:RNA polymerase sigma factor (sigma-70 family)